MAIIDPDGLFGGDRLAACSDLAQLYWPRLFLAANGCARLEMSYSSIISKIFKNFKKTPKSSDLWAVFHEYEANFLAVLYEADGIWWCQFITSEKNLPKYKRDRDKSTPAPPLELLEKHKFGYVAWKKANSFGTSDFGNFQEISYGEEKRGVGIGVGVGEERAIAPPLGVFPCSGKVKHWDFTEEHREQWAEAYPGVDVVAEVRKAKSWIVGNPAKKKTAGGMPAFLNRWLSKAQNNAGGGNGKSQGNKSPASGRIIGAYGTLDAALKRRTGESSGDPTAADGGEVPTPGSVGVDGGDASRLRDTGDTLWPEASERRAGEPASSAGPEILPPTRPDRRGV